MGSRYPNWISVKSCPYCGKTYISADTTFEGTHTKYSCHRSYNHHKTVCELNPERFDFRKAAHSGSVTLSDNLVPYSLSTYTLEKEYIKEVLLQLIPTLPKSYRVVMENRFLSEDPLTLKETGKLLKDGLTRERVRQLEKEAIDSLRMRLKLFLRENDQALKHFKL